VEIEIVLLGLVGVCAIMAFGPRVVLIILMTPVLLWCVGLVYFMLKSAPASDWQ
jgi:L-asparagine transporter-like permease